MEVLNTYKEQCGKVFSSKKSPSWWITVLNNILICLILALATPSLRIRPPPAVAT